MNEKAAGGGDDQKIPVFVVADNNKRINSNIESMYIVSIVFLSQSPISS